MQLSLEQPESSEPYEDGLTPVGAMPLDEVVNRRKERATNGERAG